MEKEMLVVAKLKEGMKEFVAGKNPVAKSIYEECVAGVHLYELSKVNI